MSTQPEALRLADEWLRKTRSEADRRNSAYDHYGMGNTPENVDPLGAKMVAELRRLHASCEDYAQHKQRQDQRVLELADSVLKLTAQRDALLEALRLMMDCAGDIATAPDSMLEMALNYDDEETRRQANAFLVARAAIKAVEKTK